MGTVGTGSKEVKGKPEPPSDMWERLYEESLKYGPTTLRENEFTMARLREKLAERGEVMTRFRARRVIKSLISKGILVLHRHGPTSYYEFVGDTNGAQPGAGTALFDGRRRAKAPSLPRHRR
jgi:hypothetical protein